MNDSNSGTGMLKTEVKKAGILLFIYTGAVNNKCRISPKYYIDG